MVCVCQCEDCATAFSLTRLRSFDRRNQKAVLRIKKKEVSDHSIEIFAEDIDAEQWQMLLRFTYADNVNRFLTSHHATQARKDLQEFIAGCVTQAYEYFLAAKTVSLNTSPMLYYYGITNLLASICSLLEGRIPSIQEHGLKFEVPNNWSRVSDFTIKTQWTTKGAFRIFCETLAETAALEGGQTWSLLEILGAIPEIQSDFVACYPAAEMSVIPLETVVQDGHSLDRIALSEFERFEEKEMVLTRVENFDKSYLQPHTTKTHLVLRPRLKREEICTFSISGQKFLRLSLPKGSRNVTLPTILHCLLGLFGLGFVSRYKPEIWTPFVRSNASGERNMIERFIRICARIAPNLSLNALHGARISFVTRPQGTVDLSERITPKKIREIVRKEIRHLRT